MLCGYHSQHKQLTGCGAGWTDILCVYHPQHQLTAWLMVMLQNGQACCVGIILNINSSSAGSCGARWTDMPCGDHSQHQLTGRHEVVL